MIATESEFRNRFWVFGLIFFVGFSCYWIDPTNIAGAAGAVLPGGPYLVFGVATILIAVAAFLRTWATAYLRTEIVHDPALHAEGVVADGPFRHVRNPLYMAVLLMAVAMGTMASRLGFVVITVLVLWFILRLIGREESELLKSQGERYRAYYDAVPRLVPSIRARLPASGAVPRWGQAFAGELFFWIFAVAMAAVAVTLDARWGLALGGVGLLLHLMFIPWWRRRVRAD